jgi:dienelactone hydrolase
MAKHLLVFSLLIHSFFASAQQDSPHLFVDVEYEAVVYSTALTWDLKDVNLYADVYVPERKENELRPLVIMVPDAYFTPTDSSTDAWDEMSRYIASCGFVVVNIQYRQGVDPDINIRLEDEFVKAISRASKDVYAAVAYFRDEALNGTNIYNIDAERVLLLGYSTGAIAALHAAKYYVDDRATTERVIRLIRQVGGWKHDLKKEELRNAIRGVVSIAGGVIDMNMYAPQDRTPVLLLQAQNDSIIPGFEGNMTISGLPLGVVYGSEAIHQQMTDKQKRVERIVYENADHTFNDFEEFQAMSPVIVEFFIEALNRLPSGKNYARPKGGIITQETQLQRSILKIHLPEEWSAPVSLDVINGSNELVYRQNEVFDKDIISIADWLAGTYTFKFMYDGRLKVMRYTINK